MEQDKYLLTELDIDYFEDSYPVIALDYYKSGSHGEDEFSREQVWFYVYGDEELKGKFEERVTELIENFFVDSDTEWDVMTLTPAHVKGTVNKNMDELMNDVSDNTRIPYEKKLKRLETIQESHDLDSITSKIVNVEGSLKAEDVEGKNVILVDNIVVSGVSMAKAADKLREAGAKNVFGVSLGISDDLNPSKISKNTKTSELLGT